MNELDQRDPHPLSRCVRYLRRSLRLRMVGLVFLIVVGSIALMAVYTLDRFEEASILQLEHEALVFSDAVQAAIAPMLAGEPDVAALQAHIDRVAAIRKHNDIEINIMLLRGYRSAIVASNNPDNIDRTDIYEHRDLLASLEEGKAVMFVGRDDDSPLGPPAPPTSPDHYIRPGYRFISITTPLVVEERKIGSINTKLSLVQLDRQLGAIRRGILMMGVVLPLLALLLVLWAIRGGLRPLRRLAGEVSQVECSHLNYRFALATAPVELQPVVERLNELLARLEAAFQRERRFAAHVAHELRTPIATLKALAQVGIEECSRSRGRDGSLGFFQDTLATAAQMERILVNLLGLVRCESGLLQVVARPLDLSQSIRSCWAAFEPDTKAKRIRFDMTLADDAVVHTDGALLEAVWHNLFSNAVNYTPEDGSIACTLEKNGDSFHFALTNSNDSVTQEDLERLCEPFWRKEAARSDAAHCGLGLSLVGAYAGLLKCDLQLHLPSPEAFRISLRIPVGAAVNAGG